MPLQPNQATLPDIRDRNGDLDKDRDIGLPGGIDGAQLEDDFAGPFLLVCLLAQNKI